MKTDALSYRRSRVGAVLIIAAVGILLCIAVLVWPAFHGRPQLSAFDEKKLVTQNNIRLIESALQAYRDCHGRYPADLDDMISDCVTKRLPNPWATVDRRRSAHDWGYTLLLGSNVQYEGWSLVLTASDGRHGAWILTQQDGCIWVDDPFAVEATRKH